jgi:hypothetical protein
LKCPRDKIQWQDSRVKFLKDYEEFLNAARDNLGIFEKKFKSRFPENFNP